MRLRVARLLATLSVMAGLVGAGSAGANATPQTAAPFQSEQSGALLGGVGGNFAYYGFAYPGGWPVDIELTPHTTDRELLKFIGFKVYGPEANREYVDGKWDDNDRIWHGSKQLYSDDRGWYVIQVYNYHPNPGTVIHYTLRGSGIPPQTAEEVVVGPEPGSAGHVAISIEGTMRGTLDARAGGSFRYYRYYQPRERSITVEMHVDPNDAGILSRAGFKVYGPERGKEYLQSEAQPGKFPNLRGVLYTTRDAEYVVQVYNYNPQTPIAYALRVSLPR